MTSVTARFARRHLESTNAKRRGQLMFSGRITHATIRILDWIADKTLPADTAPDHLRTGRRGEEAAYFYLRKLGYVMVAVTFARPTGAARST